MVSCIMRELDIRKNYLDGDGVDSIYFGGGTPSVLDIGDIESILNKIREVYQVKDDAEISFEVNPEDIDIDYLFCLKKIGVNRISIGIQAMENNILKYLNRKHNVKEAVECVNKVLKADIDNISIDLIYGIPGLTNMLWQESLDMIGELNVNHISAYCLSIDEKTVFEHRMKKGEFTPVDDEKCEEQYHMLVKWAKKNGFEHYEISNFCKPGFHSRHNSAYWKQKAYLGVGPSAHSYNKESRQWNVANNANYISSINKGVVLYEKEDLDIQDKLNEYIMTSLRTIWGIDKNLVSREFGIKYLQYIIEKASKYEETGHVNISHNSIKLTEKGMFVSNNIISEIFISDLST